MLSFPAVTLTLASPFASPQTCTYFVGVSNSVCSFCLFPLRLWEYFQIKSRSNHFIMTCFKLKSRQITFKQFKRHCRKISYAGRWSLKVYSQLWLSLWRLKGIHWFQLHHSYQASASLSILAKKKSNGFWTDLETPRGGLGVVLKPIIWQFYYPNCMNMI